MAIRISQSFSEGETLVLAEMIEQVKRDSGRGTVDGYVVSPAFENLLRKIRGMKGRVEAQGGNQPVKPTRPWLAERD